MNKKLFEMVVAKSKDTGLSEKFLQEITEKMGGSIAEDSTDEKAIEEVANLVFDVAKASQGEATRWASKKQGSGKPNTETNEPKPQENPDKGGKSEEQLQAVLDKLSKLEEKVSGYEAKEAETKRSKEIATAMEKHGIPAYLRDRFSKSISADEDVDTVVAGLKQELITNGLVGGEQGGSKGATEQQVTEVASSLLESITAK